MSTRLLSDRIRDLHLRPDAPYPSEVLVGQAAAKDAHELILQWRSSQRVRLVPGEPDEDDDHAD